MGAGGAPKRVLLGACAALLVLLAANVGLVAAEAKKEDQALLRADNIVYDPTRDVVTADGHVEISYDDQILQSDLLIYEQRTDKVTAKGNVVLIDKDGNTLFAESVELTDKLRNGVVRRIGLLLSDDSRLAANSAVRREDRITTLAKAVYSPCDVCKEKPKKAPLWQLKAKRVVHDQKEKELIYHHARFEFFGVPIAYTPYFEHPDPSVKRKTGFLTPSIGRSTDLGTILSTPFYWAIADNYDATITPIYTSNQGLVMRGEFRHRLRRGSYMVDGSFTRPKELNDIAQTTGSRDWRGHVFADGVFNLADDWRTGLSIQRVSDDTYLRRYRISSLDRLENRLFVEGIKPSRYLTVNAYSFQDLRANDVPGQSPLVLPEIMADYFLAPPFVGGRLELSASALSLTRTDGLDMRRLSSRAEWERKFILRSGQTLKAFASLRGDLYVTDDVNPAGSPLGPKNSTVIGRALPQAGVEWRWPFARNFGHVTQIIEPIVQGIYSSSGGNPIDIPNEDSPNIEYDDSSLFSRNRFSGLDRWEAGPRINYGVRSAAYWSGGGYIEGLLGQSYRFEESSPFAPGSGLENQASDIVGHVILAPIGNLSIVHRFRIDKRNFNFHRNETSINFHVWRIGAGLTYHRVNPQEAALTSNSFEGMLASATIALTKYWTLSGGFQQDLTNDRPVFRDIGLSYVDECIDFGITYRRDYTSDRDIKPSNSVILRLKLTNIG